MWSHVTNMPTDLLSPSQHREMRGVMLIQIIGNAAKFRPYMNTNLIATVTMLAKIPSKGTTRVNRSC